MIEKIDSFFIDVDGVIRDMEHRAADGFNEAFEKFLPDLKLDLSREKMGLLDTVPSVFNTREKRMKMLYAIAKEEYQGRIEKKDSLEGELQGLLKKHALDDDTALKMADYYTDIVYPDNPENFENVYFLGNSKESLNKILKTTENVVFVTDSSESFTRQWLDMEGFSCTVIGKESLPEFNGKRLGKPHAFSLLKALMIQFANNAPIDLKEKTVVMVGDGFQDIEAGKNLNRDSKVVYRGHAPKVKTILILTRAYTLEQVIENAPDYVFSDFDDFADHVVSESVSFNEVKGSKLSDKAFEKLNAKREAA